MKLDYVQVCYASLYCEILALFGSLCDSINIESSGLTEKTGTGKFMIFELALYQPISVNLYNKTFEIACIAEGLEEIEDYDDLLHYFEADVLRHESYKLIVRLEYTHTA